MLFCSTNKTILQYFFAMCVQPGIGLLNRVLAGLIETKWRISVVSECCCEAVLKSPDCIPIVGSVKS